jgi:hypothetical protein
VLALLETTTITLHGHPMLGSKVSEGCSLMRLSFSGLHVCTAAHMVANTEILPELE